MKFQTLFRITSVAFIFVALQASMRPSSTGHATYIGHMQRPAATREFHPLYSILRAEDFVPQPERKALPSHQFEPSFRESL
jgi:hypothetical protein